MTLVKKKAYSTGEVSRGKLTIRQRIYLFVIIAGLINIFFPFVAHADLFGFTIQDVYTMITDNVKETNDILSNAFKFCETSPYEVVNTLTGTANGTLTIKVRSAIKSVALIVASMLLMVDFCRKSLNFEWSSKWENIFLFLIKLIVMKQVVQNADTIVSYIYAIFQTINDAATGGSVDFLPCGTVQTFSWTVKDNLGEMVWNSGLTGWWDYWYNKGAGDNYTTYTYTISVEAVQMFYPNAVFTDPTLNLAEHPLPNPNTSLFFPTLEIVFLQVYFWIMKATAYFIFVIAMGRVFELSIYTIFAPLPLSTFASEISQDVAKNFIKNYIATVLQIATVVIMFILYVALTKFMNNYFSGLKLIQMVTLIALALGVVKSGAWSKKICGIG